MVVLVAEDEWVIRCCIAETLADAGFEVIEAEHGESALDALQRHAPDIDVLFTDIRLPGNVDGLELAKRARALIPGLAVLIGSGNARPSPDDVPPGAKFLPKPYSFRSIPAQVGALLDDTYVFVT